MEDRAIYEDVRAARAQAEEGRKSLVEASPAALERCAESLKAAITGLIRCRAARGGPSEQVRTEALRLRADLGALTRLLDHAAEYHARWMGFAGSVWAGYTGSGAAADVPRRGRLLTQG